MVIMGLLFLCTFVPDKLPRMVKDFGRFVGETRRHVDVFKSEPTFTENGGSSEPQRGDHTGFEQS